MTSQPLSSLSVSILCQLLVSARSGYSLKKTFQDTPMGHFSSSPGAIYPALQRMEKVGWISGTVDNPESLRARRVYSISMKGREVLKNLFLTPLTRNDLIHGMDLVLLRFAFMTRLLGRSATISYLKQLTELLEAYVAELNHSAKELVNDPLEGVLALRHGCECYKTHLRWARTALRELSEIENEYKA